MDGLVLIDKEKGKTSRDVVNSVGKLLKTRKVGHTGTLDPLATGLLIICVNEGCKLVELLTGHDKDYIAKVRLGISTDTYDITGNIIDENYDYNIDKEKITGVLNSFLGEYEQEVPIYSALKVNGKKLYQYAREGKNVKLPIHNVEIKDIKLLSMDSDSFSFFVTVSSGTYIRSLINDISKRIDIPMTMEELRRTRVGNYKVEDASSYSNINIIPIVDALDIKKVELDDTLFKRVSNGVKLNNIYDSNMVLFVKDNIPIAIYKSNGNLMVMYRKFNILR